MPNSIELGFPAQGTSGRVIDKGVGVLADWNKMQQLAQVKERPFPVKMGEVNYSQSEDVRLETTRARFSYVLKKHGELTDRLSRDSDKMVFERLQREFEAARASQTQEICLDVEQWNDGLLATLRERVWLIKFGSQGG